MWAWVSTIRTSNVCVEKLVWPRLLQRVRLAHLWCNAQNMTSLVRHCTKCTHWDLSRVNFLLVMGKVSILSLVLISISIPIIAYFFHNSSEVFPNTDVKIVQNFHKSMLKNVYKGSPHFSTNFIKISRNIFKMSSQPQQN